MLCMCVTSHLCTFYVSVHFLPENYFYWSTFNIRYFKIVPTAIWLSLLPKSYFKIISLLLLLFNFCLISVNLLHPEQDVNLLNIHLHLCFCILAICFPLLHVCLLSCSNKKKSREKKGDFWWAEMDCSLGAVSHLDWEGSLCEAVVVGVKPEIWPVPSSYLFQCL